MRAVIYVRQPAEQGTWAGYELHKAKALAYCEEKGYDSLVLIGLNGSAKGMKQYGQEKLLRLAEKQMVDVIVVPDLRMISESQCRIQTLQKRMEAYGVLIDCMAPVPEGKISVFPCREQTGGQRYG